MQTLDTSDKLLLETLQKNAKLTIKQLAALLKLSATAVHERIKKLEKNHIITGYVALLNREKVHKSYLVFCHVKLVQHTREYLNLFEREVLELPEVMECHHVSGDYDYILKICVADMKAYRAFMVNKLTRLKHIGSTQSSFVIAEVKNSTAIGL